MRRFWNWPALPRSSLPSRSKSVTTWISGRRRRPSRGRGMRLRQFESSCRASWTHQGNIARALLGWLSPPDRADQFAQAIQGIARDITWDSFKRLRASCGQVSGFATPLTFLSSFDPERFPMVDQSIGDWWARRFPRQPQFSRRDDGWVGSNLETKPSHTRGSEQIDELVHRHSRRADQGA